MHAPGTTPLDDQPLSLLTWCRHASQGATSHASLKSAAQGSVLQLVPEDDHTKAADLRPTFACEL